MAREHDVHRLSPADAAALAAGEFPAETVELLRAAELSKHLLLLEALRRTIGSQPDRDGATPLNKAMRVLDDVQVRRPEVVAEVLGLPHFGFWVARCLSRLRRRATSGAGLEGIRDLGQLSAFAAVSALQIGYPFDLPVPVFRGGVTFPTLGTAWVGPSSMSGWARVRHDRDGTTVRSAARTVGLRLSAKTTVGAHPAWRQATRLEAVSDGIRLGVVLETSDPFLTLLNPAASRRALPSVTAWQRRLEAAWDILVRHDRTAAAGLAQVITALVPLDEPVNGDLISATSGWAWGAIAMSLPADILLMAETLQHEFHHLVLAAAEDLTPLVRQDDGGLYYAPWREDPRPASALIQGTYAHLGVAGFWRQRRRAEPPGNHLVTEIRFVRACRAAYDTADVLAHAGVLTQAGQAFTAGMLSRLRAWQDEPVGAAAQSAAAEIGSEHRLRWALAHLRCDARAIDRLARAWLASRPQPTAGLPPAGTVSPYRHRLRPDLSELMEMRYRDPAGLARLLAGESLIEPCDAALLKGDWATAREGYLRLIEASRERSAWVGFLLTRQRITGSQERPDQRPEVIADLHDRILALTLMPPDVESLIGWLSKLREPAS